MEKKLHTMVRAAEDISIGIDIGGTNTDAVLIQNKKIITAIKTNTTSDVKEGVITAITQLLQKAQIVAAQIRTLVVGTTHFINMVLQAKGLNEVLAIRLAKPATTAVEPLLDWPSHLREAVGNCYEIVFGGHEYNGAEIAALDEQRIKELAYLAKEKNIAAIAISGVFSHVNPAHEIMAAKIIKDICPDLSITLSHLVGGINLLPRENAAILNAALAKAFNKMRTSVNEALQVLGLIKARLFFSTNDGNLEDPNSILPIVTYGSGASNSMCGAGLLAAKSAAIVADIGGTSTDVGILKDGFPLAAGCEIKIGNEKEGLNCNFPAPLTRSCALGGGTIITQVANNDLIIGPESVGYELNKKAIIFGGDILTITDIAVAQGRLLLGEPARLKIFDQVFLKHVDDLIHAKLVNVIEQILPYTKAATTLPLILVGGGAVLFDKIKLQKLLESKIQRILIPKYAGNANALGAAVAKISGNFDGVFQYSNWENQLGVEREQALSFAKQQAIANVVAKGAAFNSVIIQGIDETPINYLPGNPTHLHVKVIGERE